MPGDAAGFAVLGAPFEFFLFGATLVGVAVFHRHTLNVALAGVGAIALYKLAFTGFDEGAGFAGLGGHLAGEWVILANLALLLTGFAILTRHFEQSKLPDLAPDVLPDDWTGGLTLLALIFVVSGFLDNIAAALIGATVARHVYKNKVHIGFLAAIVAAANAGGAGSVVGDTTTTMMWISGKSPLDVAHGYVGALTAFAIFAIPAARMQQKYQPILKHDVGGIRPDWWRVGIVVFILVAAVVANVVTSIVAPQVSAAFPVIGAAVWGAVLALGPRAQDRPPNPPRGGQGNPVPAVAGARRFVHAGEGAARSVVGDDAQPRLHLGGVRQHSADGARHQAGRLRLGHPRLRRRLRRLDDLVRLVGRALPSRISSPRRSR